jgi:hypothetical protein
MNRESLLEPAQMYRGNSRLLGSGFITGNPDIAPIERQQPLARNEINAADEDRRQCLSFDSTCR